MHIKSKVYSENVSGIDRGSGLFAVKLSGVEYDGMSVGNMVAVNLHSPFAWGADAMDTVHNAAAMEEATFMGRYERLLTPALGSMRQTLCDKHYLICTAPSPLLPYQIPAGTADKRTKRLLPEGRCAQAQGFSVGYGRFFGWFQPMSVTPRNLNTSNRALP